MKKQLTAFLLAFALMAGLAAPAYAVMTEQDMAVQYLTQEGIYKGDQNGNLHLESGLTRAELAVILTRIRGDEAKVLAAKAEYTTLCYFIDVPEWAKPYVGYCADSLLMNGYSLFDFGPGDTVTPQAACTVILRHLGYKETDWSYLTACTKAVAVGIAPEQGLGGTSISRGDFAVIIYRAVTGSTQPQGEQANTPITEKVLDGGDWAREDFSQAANPAVFDSIYTRAAYNAIRQSMVDRDTIIAGNNADGFNPSYRYAYTTASAETRAAVKLLLPSVDVEIQYNTGAEPSIAGLYKYPDYFIIQAQTAASLSSAKEATEEILHQSESMSDAEKIRYFNDMICDRMEFDASKSAGINTVFTSDTQVKGACTSYAGAFLYLCDRAGIPCTTIGGENHTWNTVYVDGSWLHVDVQLNDGSPTRSAMLLSETSRKTDRNPAETNFVRELLVPGSTK
ncbi:S-layer homology domain-containing protein [Oscillospiraceae bacterium OttesenSCG-928-G22]|nr:S-layer homology domain-containing protein [Oscillospiraceae bacterium OttesenSCG-928-G22]